MNQTNLNMEKLLEIFINDEGEMALQSSNEQLFERFMSLDEYDLFFKKLLARMTDIIWKDRNVLISKVIRILSMAEICACAEPYEHAEEFWSTMMFHCIPHFEEYADSLKRKFGDNPDSKHRPFTVGEWPAAGMGMTINASPFKGMN